MSWAKLDDQLHGHRKILRAWKNRPALGLHLMAMSYSASHEPKGFVPEEFVEEKLPNAKERDAVVRVLTEVLPGFRAGLWEPVDGGWRIHDWDEYNGDAKTREEVRAAKSAAGKKGAAARWGDKQTDGTPDGTAMAEPMAPATPPANGTAMAPFPYPSHIGPSDHVASSPEAGVIAALFAYWQQRCEHPASKLTDERRRKITARLKQGYTPEQIREGIDGAAAAPFVNDNGKAFDDIELICRTGSKLEDFISRTRPGRTPSNGRRETSGDLLRALADPPPEHPALPEGEAA